MWGSNWLLSAWLVGTPYPFHRVIVKLIGGFGAEFNFAGPGLLPSLVNVFVPPVSAPHFPYGRNVEAD